MWFKTYESLSDQPIHDNIPSIKSFFDAKFTSPCTWYLRETKRPDSAQLKEVQHRFSHLDARISPHNCKFQEYINERAVVVITILGLSEEDILFRKVDYDWRPKRVFRTGKNFEA